MNPEVPHWTSPVAGARTAHGETDKLCDPGKPDRVVAHVTQGNATTLDAAMSAARAAFTSWAAMPPPMRGDHLARFLTALEEDAEVIARQMTLEQGKILAESRGEVAKAIGEARYVLGETYRTGMLQRPSTRPAGSNIARRVPHGVVAAINPWNFPFSTPMRKIMPALVMGNTIVLKPSELTPGPLCLLAAAAVRAGMPEGVINVVIGTGSDIGRAMVTHPGIDMVTFTGSTSTGRSIAISAAGRLLPVQLEMGGKNAAIVTASADLEHAAREVTRSALVCSGQRCTAISRVLVDQRHVGKMTEFLHHLFAGMRVGHGLEPESNLGPLVSAVHLEKVHNMVTKAKQEGARIVEGGAPLQRPGHFYPPTLIDQAENGSEILTQEVFGPVLTITPFWDLEEAVRLHEDSVYGLTGAIFGTDVDEITFLRDKMKTGMLHVNSGTFPENNMPFAGTKHSAFGAPSVGEQALEGFSRWQSIYT